jgi:hypothetical protein
MTTRNREVPLYVLIAYGRILKHLDSFTYPVCGCNFVVRNGWGGNYVESHNVGDRKLDLRADEVLKLKHIHLDDIIELTEDQFNDFQKVSSVGVIDSTNSKKAIKI